MCTAIFRISTPNSISIFPPDSEEGYGISHKIIDLIAEQDVKLVIILDCGIKANEEIAYAKSLGIDFIICDHHMPDEKLPEAVAILNPKLEGSSYPCPHLSGCGVGYKFMQAFSISNGIATAELECMLDLVAVSIAADIVPMVDENRVLAYMGLKRLNSNPNNGSPCHYPHVRALADKVDNHQMT